FFFSSRRRHTRWPRDWSSDVCSSDLIVVADGVSNDQAQLLVLVEVRRRLAICVQCGNTGESERNDQATCSHHGPPVYIASSPTSKPIARIHTSARPTAGSIVAAAGPPAATL